MLGILCAAVVDPAAGNDHDVAVFADIEVIVDDFLEAALAHDDRNVDTLVFGPGLDCRIRSPWK